MSDEKKDVTEEEEKNGSSEEEASSEDEASEEQGPTDEETSEDTTSDDEEDDGAADEEEPAEDEEEPAEDEEEPAEDEEEPAEDEEEPAEDEEESAEDEEESAEDEEESAEDEEESAEDEEEPAKDEEEMDDEPLGEKAPPADATEKVAEVHEGEVDDLHEKETVEATRGHADVIGVAAFFDHPDHLMYAAEQTRDSNWEQFDAFSPFPIHGMDHAMGLGRSWIPWVTFFAGLTGFTTACILEFGIMGYDWPMVFGGKPYIAWPSFVPVMFELTVLFAGVTTAIVMLAAAGCFRKPLIIDPEITNDRFVLWISAEDERFDRDSIVEFMKGLNPMEIRTLRKDA